MKTHALSLLGTTRLLSRSEGEHAKLGEAVRGPVEEPPFSKVSPLLAKLLDMPTFASDGCASVCVKVMGSEHSASER